MSVLVDFLFCPSAAIADAGKYGIASAEEPGLRALAIAKAVPASDIQKHPMERHRCSPCQSAAALKKEKSSAGHLH